MTLVTGSNASSHQLLTRMYHHTLDLVFWKTLIASREIVQQRLKAVTQDAVARGVFGAPTFFVDGQMYWGQDRLDFVKEALEAST